MIRQPELVAMLKHACARRLPGVSLFDTGVEAVPSVGDQNYRVLFTINEATLIGHINGRELVRARDKDDMIAAIAKPFKAIAQLYDDGVAEGRDHERRSEIRALREHQENAYRSLRHQAMADAWNAVANGGVQ